MAAITYTQMVNVPEIKWDKEGKPLKIVKSSEIKYGEILECSLCNLTGIETVNGSTTWCRVCNSVERVTRKTR